MELTVTVALLMLVLVPTLMSLQSAERSSGDLRSRTEVRAQARFALDALLRDFRQAQTGDAGLPAVSGISSTTLSFYSPDKSVPYKLRKITYLIVGSQLKRSVTKSTNTGSPPWTFGPTAPATEFAFALKPGSTFVAYDSAGAVTTNAAEVRKIDVTLVVNDLTRSGAAQTFRQSAEIRTATS